ncbi:hypothetical protein TrCOL_g3516 [Triparma columacea]|uniref:Uncharacterized protein n=1 Tax=Triparma columacea TaxID=722753 RepID=A0A9W7FYK5_9STRA|nr:hypothetical protein TrCOL_g3516 [Triparma columacea]
MASDVASRNRSLPEPHAKQAQGHPTAVASVEDLKARRDGFEDHVNRDGNPPMVPRHRIYLEEASGYGRNGDSPEASNTVIEAPEELSKCASQYTPASLYGFVMNELLDADRVHGDGGRCIGLTKRQSSNGQCRLPVEAITPPSTTGARSNQHGVKEEGKREPKGDSATLDLNKEGREELLGGEQTNPNEERMDKLSGGLSKGEIGTTVEAITTPSTTSTESAHLGLNKEGREELLGGEQTNPNDERMDKLSGGLSKGEIDLTFEAVMLPLTTSAESAHLDLNKEGREEHLGGKQTNPNDGRMDKLSGGLSKGEIDLTDEAVRPPSTTGAESTHHDLNKEGREGLWGGEQMNPNDERMDKLSRGLSKREIGTTVEAITPPSTISTESTHRGLNKEGREELLGGEQTNPNDELMDKLSWGLSKREIGTTVEAIMALSTISAESADLDLNKEGKEEHLGGEQTNPNDGRMDKLSGNLSKGEIGPTVEAVTALSTTSAESVHLDVNKEGREELLGGEQTNPKDGRMEKLSGGLSKGEIDLTFEAITPPSTTGAYFAPITANEPPCRR